MTSGVVLPPRGGIRSPGGRSPSASGLDDQTPLEWRQSADPTETGTGLILDRTGRKTFESAITYRQFYRRAMRKMSLEKSGLSVKWVPHSVQSELSIKRMRCGLPCVNTCEKPGCICNRGRGVCVA
jgi:hypothetical protein